MDTFITFLSGHWPLFCGVFTSILLAAFFAASETAMLFANKARLHQLADEGNARAEAALGLALERNRLHSSLLLVENFFLVLAVVQSTVIALHLFGEALPAIAATSVAMSIVVVLFAKLAPKGLVGDRSIRGRHRPGFDRVGVDLAPLGEVVREAHDRIRHRTSAPGR